MAPCTCCPYYTSYSSIDLGASSEQWVIRHSRLPWRGRCRQPYPEHQLCLSSLFTDKAKAHRGILPLCKHGALSSEISYLKTYLFFSLFGWDFIFSAVPAHFCLKTITVTPLNDLKLYCPFQDILTCPLCLSKVLTLNFSTWLLWLWPAGLSRGAQYRVWGLEKFQQYQKSAIFSLGLAHLPVYISPDIVSPCPQTQSISTNVSVNPIPCTAFQKCP